MSLVSEALKKAQREAAAREKGLPAPLQSATTQPFRARRRRAPGAAIALAAALLAAALGGGLYWWSAREPAAARQARPEKAPEKERPDAESPVVGPEAFSTAAPATATAQPIAPSPAALLTTQPPSVPETAPSDAATATPRSATAATPTPPYQEAFSAPAPAAAAPTSPPPAPARAVAPPAAARGAASATFVREATLADGSTVRLGGIAYSDAAPLAYLNGKLVGVGERVEGCRVERIERARVALDCAGARILLALK